MVQQFSLLTCFVSGALALSACDRPPERHEEPGTFRVTHPLRRDADLSRQYVAQVRASQHIELRAFEHGYLKEIFVDEGQEIKAGQKMFQIMPQIYAAEVGKAKAEADLANIEYKNVELLANQDVVAPTELALAKAKASKARAELSLASAHKKLALIHAPFAGIMGRFNVRKGSLLEEGELLTTLSDNSTVWVYFNVTEREYLDFRTTKAKAELAPVRLLMANGEMFDQLGHIDTIEADFNNETGNIAFRASFPNPDGLLRHGETGKIVMPTPIANALIIPQKATFEILDRQYVFVVNAAGMVTSQAVDVIAEMPHMFVVEGLEEDDQILLEGLRKVRDGAQIEFSVADASDVFFNLELPAE